METIDSFPGRVLLVGDGREHIQSCRETLTQEGHEVYSALDPAQALAIVENWAPDLVLILYQSEDDGCAALDRLATSPVIGNTLVLLGCDVAEKIPSCCYGAGGADIVFPQTVERLAREVSSLMRLKEQKAQLVAQMRRAQRMKALGTLSGGIAHDFNNILTPVLLHAEMALADVSEENPLHIHLREIVKASKRARDLVKQILAFSRREEEKRISLQLSVIIKETVKLLRASFPSTIEISLRIDDDSDHWIFADPVQMNQVFLNLATNAFQAMREKGGLLDVRLEVVALARGELAGPEGEAGRFICLTVSDTGCGIEKEMQPGLFEPVFGKKHQGTGMGLAMVHEIVKSHRGMIKVASTPGEGSVFKVFLPVTEPEESSDPDVAPALRGSERILYVDDEAAMRNTMGSLLKHLGYRVETSESGKSALDLFTADPKGFDLVLTDYTMPGMTGIELSLALLRICPDLPVILCTGFSEEVTDEGVRSLGIRRLVFKPFGLREIAGILREVLGDG